MKLLKNKWEVQRISKSEQLELQFTEEGKIKI